MTKAIVGGEEKERKAKAEVDGQHQEQLEIKCTASFEGIG